jgi:hypothetical protein
MKRLSKLLVSLLIGALAVPAFAHGGFGHGGHGGFGPYGGFRGGYEYRRGWDNNWVGPVIGATILGGALYARVAPCLCCATTADRQCAPQGAYYCQRLPAVLSQCADLSSALADRAVPLNLEGHEFLWPSRFEYRTVPPRVSTSTRAFLSP